MIANDQELKVTLALADNVAIVTGKSTPARIATSLAKALSA